MVKELRMNKDKVSLVIMIALGIVVILYVISSVRKRRVSENIRISELISASLVLVNRAGERVVEVRGMDDAEIGRLSKGLTKEGKQEFVTFGDKVSKYECSFLWLNSVASWTFHIVISDWAALHGCLGISD